MADQITNYQCPACTGRPLHFVGASGRLECDTCGSSYSVDEIEALYQSKRHRPRPRPPRRMLPPHRRTATRALDRARGAATGPKTGCRAIPARPAARARLRRIDRRDQLPLLRQPLDRPPAACPARRNRTISSPSASSKADRRRPQKALPEKPPCPRPFRAEPYRADPGRLRPVLALQRQRRGATSPINAPGR